MKIIRSLSLILLATSASLAAAREPLTDHPLISPYEGSEIRRKNVQEFDAYSAFIGMSEDGKTPQGIELEGKITKLFYTKPKERSILEVFRNYELAVDQIGAEVLYTCDQEKKDVLRAMQAQPCKSSLTCTLSRISRVATYWRACSRTSIRRMWPLPLARHLLIFT